MEKRGNNMERKMKNKVIIFFLFILIVSCNRNSQMEKYMVSPELYEFDKKTITEAYLNNIEYYRLHYPYDLVEQAFRAKDSNAERLLTEQLERHFQKYPKVKHDPVNFYKPYAHRTSLLTKEDVKSPIPSKEQIFVSTDSIIYNKNASLCIAFLCIETKFDDIKGMEKIPHIFSAEAMVGYRKHPKDTLKTYPLSFFRLMGYDKKKPSLMI